MPTNLELLNAGFSAILGARFTSGPNVESIASVKEFSIHDLFHQTFDEVHKDQDFEIQFAHFEDDDQIVSNPHIAVLTLTGERILIPFKSPKHTIIEVKYLIEAKGGYPKDQQRLVFNGQVLSDEDTFEKVGIFAGATLHLIVRLLGGECPTYRLKNDELDLPYDYDFTNTKDDGKTYMRGGFEYKRPYGWKRVAIKVLGRYESSDWLGPNGIRTSQVPREWPVAYHGTNFTNANSILQKGLKPGDRALYEKGVYTSPSLQMVEKYYAQEFKYEGKSYKIVFQSRVNPDQSNGHLKIIPASKTGVGADYWLSPKQNVRKAIPKKQVIVTSE
ncbi:uncharacterized protein LOC116611845 isoform X2 [Nematostella vectensis]|uniref:uncharacterized protein LOC116611845 isoform X2 n=1 Tax=Nematostella vectensis TaxID=45351 RepID=UPI002077079A|nr:uncharacterized protein LOC116611845 isoform X2 [Nematostella vectensis]